MKDISHIINLDDDPLDMRCSRCNERVDLPVVYDCISMNTEHVIQVGMAMFPADELMASLAVPCKSKAVARILAEIEAIDHGLVSDPRAPDGESVEYFGRKSELEKRVARAAGMKTKGGVS